MWALTFEKPQAPIPEQVGYDHADDLHGLRLWVRAHAIDAGLTPARADLLMLAVSELASNTLLYTSGGGLVRMSAQDGGVVCEVTDEGPVAARTARAMPPAHAPSGRGLAIVERVCDDVAIRTEGTRTVVRLWLRSG